MTGISGSRNPLDHHLFLYYGAIVIDGLPLNPLDGRDRTLLACCTSTVLAVPMPLIRYIAQNSLKWAAHSISYKVSLLLERFCTGC
jgi:hypothetical protein